MKRFFLSFILLFCLPALAFAWDGKVTKIHDGDTITVRSKSDGRSVKVRLWGIDCPEYTQPYGKEAMKFVKALLPVGTSVQMKNMDQDSYKRSVSIVRLSDGRIVQEELLKAGLAWVYRKHCQGCDSWYALEDAAREKKRGLWMIKHSMPPWEWRERQR